MAPGAWPLAYGRLPGPGTARHLLVGSSQSPPRPGGPTDRDMVDMEYMGGPRAADLSPLTREVCEMTAAPHP